MKKILFIGDIIGKGGRNTVRHILPSIKKEYSPDLTIANGENSAGGFGINEKNSAIASRIIKEAMGVRMVKLYDQGASRKFAKYVPFWA